MNKPNGTYSYGLALLANSYIGVSDKIFYDTTTIYVYDSTIVPFLLSLLQCAFLGFLRVVVSQCYSLLQNTVIHVVCLNFSD
jgi:hypothetical protein